MVRKVFASLLAFALVFSVFGTLAFAASRPDVISVTVDSRNTTVDGSTVRIKNKVTLDNRIVYVTADDYKKIVGTAAQTGSGLTRVVLADELGSDYSVTNCGNGVYEYRLKTTSGKGTQANPYAWDDLKNDSRVTWLNGGYKFTNKSNNWAEVYVVIDGDLFGKIDYGNSWVSKDGQFGTATVGRGETITLQLYEATFWLQQQPIKVDDFVFGTKNCSQAPGGKGYGWVYTPAEPISFVVPSHQGIKEVHAYDARNGKTYTYRPGDTAYIGREGATFWLKTAWARGDRNASYDK